MSEGAWQPIEQFHDRYQANLTAISERDERLAQQIMTVTPSRQYVVAMHGQTPTLGHWVGDHCEPLPTLVTKDHAAKVAASMTPGNVCSLGLMVTGLDQGWLEEALYAVPCRHPALPGHRPPLYFLSSNLERFWAVLHLHDWKTMLRDPRVLWFVGHNAVAQVEKYICEPRSVPWPQMAVTVEKRLWAEGVNLDSVLRSAQTKLEQRAETATQQLRAIYGQKSVEETHARIASGEKLRVLGITSRFTTFLQHSMRDWLSAMRRLGHDTRLIIEDADHEVFGSLKYTEACAQYRPDIVLMIDHYRAELRMLPEMLPVVMWIQDRLPNMFCTEAGKSQQQMDYCLGHGRLECVEKFGYPAERFIATTLGINDSRFAPRKLFAREQEQFGCDVSFVSHAGVPAETIIAEEIDRHPDPLGKKFLNDAFERLRAIYESGKAVTQPPMIRALLRESLDACSVTIKDLSGVEDLFVNRINNALFRHQSVAWASELDINLHLYGKGWSAHPKFSRFAKGIAGNQEQLLAIHLATKINLQVFPHGAIHQRLLDGLAGGGFFLLRHCPCDEAEVIYRKIWSWCREHGVESDAELKSQAPAAIQRLVAQLRDLFEWDPYQFDSSLVEIMRLADDCQYLRSAATMFPEQYPSIAFNSREQLHKRIGHFLKNEQERATIVAAMRPVVIENYSYRSISQRMLNFIAADLSGQIAQRSAA